VDECGIGEHPAIVALWQKRKRWIAAYFKGMYCGIMTSTQRSESQNIVLKDGYVGSVTTLHMFAKRVLDCSAHRPHGCWGVALLTGILKLHPPTIFCDSKPSQCTHGLQRVTICKLMLNVIAHMVVL
jgi:hypothetical protein